VNFGDPERLARCSFAGQQGGIASRLNFWDGRPHQNGQLRVNNVLGTANDSLVGLSDDYRLYGIHYGVAQASVMNNGSGQITNQVVLRASSFSLPSKVTGTPGRAAEPWGQNTTLVHEFLGIPARFGRDAGAISMWLQAGCPKE
jgi:hypothetical protein